MLCCAVLYVTQYRHEGHLTYIPQTLSPPKTRIPRRFFFLFFLSFVCFTRVCHMYIPLCVYTVRTIRNCTRDTVLYCLLSGPWTFGCSMYSTLPYSTLHTIAKFHYNTCNLYIALGIHCTYILSDYYCVP